MARWVVIMNRLEEPCTTAKVVKVNSLKEAFLSLSDQEDWPKRINEMLSTSEPDIPFNWNYFCSNPGFSRVYEGCSYHAVELYDHTPEGNFIGVYTCPFDELRWCRAGSSSAETLSEAAEELFEKIGPRIGLSKEQWVESVLRQDGFFYRGWVSIFTPNGERVMDPRP
jgi:hypothetical protein